MKKSAYGNPYLLDKKGKPVSLLKAKQFDEATIQNFIFSNPDCLPISEIDESYNPLISICTELNTPAGPMDIFMISPNGDLTIIETKLWANPDARRIVVAQILDYAKELSKWTYEDLQREINRKLGLKGNSLYQKAIDNSGELVPNEQDFVDAVSRNLRKGKFLLLIAGDGIREGAIGITEFIASSGNLNFSFAMVEMSLYQADDLGVLCIPKTIIKTIDTPKFSVEIADGLQLIEGEINSVNPSNNTPLTPEKERERKFYENFWEEFVNQISFDDPGQPLPKPAKAQNLYIYPITSRKAWISAYFAKSSSEIGVYFKTQNDNDGQSILQGLSQFQDEIELELKGNLSWSRWNEVVSCGVSMKCADIFDPKNREEIMEFFSIKTNLYVNVFRPLLKSIQS